MNGVDIFVLIILAFFILRGLIIGFIKEVLSLLGLILAVFVSLKFSDYMTFYLKFIKDPLLLKIASILVLFALVILGTQLVIFLLRKAIKPTFLGVLDKLLGLIIGFVEGFVIAGTILYFAGRFDIVRPYIENSKFSHKISKAYENYVINHFSDIREFFKGESAEK